MCHLLLLLFAVAHLGCSNDERLTSAEPNGATAEVVFTVNFPEKESGVAAKVAAITTIRAYLYSDLTKERIAQADFQIDGGTAVVTLQVPVGTPLQVDVVFFDQTGPVRYLGTAKFTAQAGIVNQIPIEVKNLEVRVLTFPAEIRAGEEFEVAWPVIEGTSIRSYNLLNISGEFPDEPPTTGWTLAYRGTNPFARITLNEPGQTWFKVTAELTGYGVTPPHHVKGTMVLPVLADIQLVVNVPQD